MTARRRIGVLEGALVVAALGCVPLALAAALRAPVVESLHGLVDALVVLAAVTWVTVTVGLGRLVVHRVRGGAIEPGPMGWAAVRVAAVVLLVAPFLDSSTGVAAPHRSSPGGDVAGRGAIATAVAAPSHTVSSATPADRAVRWARRPHGARCRHARSTPALLGTGVLLVALAADARRRSRLSRRVGLDTAAAVDLETALLAGRAAPWPRLASVASALGACGRLDAAVHLVLAHGEAALADGTWRFDPATAHREVRGLVIPLGELDGAVHVLLVPRGVALPLAGPGARSCVEDAVRVGAASGLGRTTLAGQASLERALALRADDEVVVCVGSPDAVEPELRARCVVVDVASPTPLVEVGDDVVALPDGRLLAREALTEPVRALLDGGHDAPLDATSPTPLVVEDRGVVVRLLASVPRVDGLAAPLEPGRERRSVELLAYLALRGGDPVTGERLRVRVLGTDAADAAAKTLFNVASGLRRALGEGHFGQRLPAAGRVGRYAVTPDVVCDVAVLEARVATARGCELEEERMAWLRAALELIESEPFATVLEGYEWFLAEGHLSRLQAACEAAACELVDLALAHGLLELAAYAVDRAALVDPYSERLATAAALLAAARDAQASFEAIVPAARSTVPSAPATT